MISIVLSCDCAISLLDCFRHKIKLVHIFFEGFVSSWYYQNSELGISPLRKLFLFLFRLLQIFLFQRKVRRCSSKWLGRTDLYIIILKEVVINDALNKGDFDSIMNLMNSSAVVAEKYPVIDANIYLLKDLWIIVALFYIFINEIFGFCISQICRFLFSHFPSAIDTIYIFSWWVT